MTQPVLVLWVTKLAWTGRFKVILRMWLGSEFTYKSLDAVQYSQALACISSNQGEPWFLTFLKGDWTERNPPMGIFPILWAVNTTRTCFLLVIVLSFCSSAELRLGPVEYLLIIRIHALLWLIKFRTLISSPVNTGFCAKCFFFR